MNNGAVEIIFFHNLYTAKSRFDNNWEKQARKYRTNYYAGIVEATYGISDRVDIGLDATYQAVRQQAPAIETLTFQRNRNAHHAFTSVMPKLKLAPFKKLANLTVESGVQIPLSNDPEGNDNDRPFLAFEDVQWRTEIFYVNNLSKRFQLFSELDAYWQISKEGPFTRHSAMRTPGSVFFSYFPGNRWSVYAMGEFRPTWGGQGISAAYYQNGLGFKYQITNTLEIEGLYTQFLAGKKQGAGKTFNIGFRFQR